MVAVGSVAASGEGVRGGRKEVDAIKPRFNSWNRRLQAFWQPFVDPTESMKNKVLAEFFGTFWLVCADRHWVWANLDPFNWYTGDQPFGEPGAQHRTGLVCGRLGSSATLALLGSSASGGCAGWSDVPNDGGKGETTGWQSLMKGPSLHVSRAPHFQKKRTHEKQNSNPGLPLGAAHHGVRLWGGQETQHPGHLG